MPTTTLFVYGTLQRGGERESCWPRAPQSVVPAKTRGALYDLGHYPAMLPGDDWVEGELWLIAADDWTLTLQVLDEVEGFAQRCDDLYVRQLISCQDAQGASHTAYAYFLADPSGTAGARRIAANADGICRWPKPL